MHTLSLYTLRAFDRDHKYDDGSHYPPMDNVKGKDIIKIFKEYLRSLERKGFLNFVDDKNLLTFGWDSSAAHGRCIYGVLGSGSYGAGSKIQDPDTGQVNYNKSPKEADIYDKYFLLFAPSGKNEAILALHGVRNNGMKSILENGFGALFKERTKLRLQLNNLSYDQAVQKWLDSEVKEIRAVEFKPYGDKADAISGMGHKHSELILRPEKKKTFGLYRKLKDNKPKAIEYLEGQSRAVKAVVEIDGKQRTFTLSGGGASPVSKIDVEDGIVDQDGLPDFDKMHKWAIDIVNELCSSVYPGGKVKI